jgi:hypothetical protein
VAGTAVPTLPGGGEPSAVKSVFSCANKGAVGGGATAGLGGCGFMLALEIEVISDYQRSLPPRLQWQAYRQHPSTRSGRKPFEHPYALRVCTAAHIAEGSFGPGSAVKLHQQAAVEVHSFLNFVHCILNFAGGARREGAQT